MPDQRQADGTKSSSRAQNIFALVVVAVFIVVVGFGGWYLRSRNRGGSGAQMQMGSGAGASAPTQLSPIHIGQYDAYVKGGFHTPQSDIEIEFKDSQGKLVEVGKVRVLLDMNMPGMVMHDDGEVTGGGGRYRVRLKPQMAGDWSAKLSFNGPQGAATKSFQVNVM